MFAAVTGPKTCDTNQALHPRFFHRLDENARGVREEANGSGEHSKTGFGSERLDDGIGTRNRGGNILGSERIAIHFRNPRMGERHLGRRSSKSAHLIALIESSTDRLQSNAAA